jgi:signal transduction histidine kinase
MKIEVSPPFWQSWWFRMIVIIVLGILILFIIRSYLSQRLRNQEVEFEQQRAVEAERARISSELHDDIGGSLTAIRLMSEMMKERAPEGIFRASLEKISYSSNELIQRMNEIVWALNINHDNLQSLVSYTRQFAVAYLDDLDIKCIVDLPDHIPEVEVPGMKRRAIFLSVKEALNNIAKHSDATEVHIRFSVTDTFQIILEDNGKGFDPYNVRINANGLVNQHRRMSDLNGHVHLTTEPGSGTTIKFIIPFSTLSEKPKIFFGKKNTV